MNKYYLLCKQDKQQIDIENSRIPVTTATAITANYYCYTQGELTSQNLWSRYLRHFVGITSHNVLS